MKKRILIVIIVALALGVFLYYFRFVAPGASWTGQNPNAGSVPAAANKPIPAPNYPIPASSYGKEAVGATSAASTGLVKPQPTEAVGILKGSTKLATGSTRQLTSIKVAISDPQTGKILGTANLGADGTYTFTVLPGEYVVNIVSGTGSSPQLPQRVYVGANETIEVNFLVK